MITKAQASSCSTFHIMRDVPSIAVFCGERIECFPLKASRFFFQLFVTILVAPVIACIIIHFMSHIRCTYIRKLLYLSFFSASFPSHFCSLLLPHLTVKMFSLFSFLIIVSCLYETTSLSLSLSLCPLIP